VEIVFFTSLNFVKVLRFIPSVHIWLYMSVGENGTLVGKNPPLQSKSTITILYRTIDNKIRRVTRCFSNLHSTLCFVIKKQVEK